jgi:hypothetical protein
MPPCVIAKIFACDRRQAVFSGIEQSAAEITVQGFFFLHGMVRF